MRVVIDTSAVKEHVLRLKAINRSALPVAVRQALNSAAYDVKTNTMPKSSEVFVHRKPTFFKASSKVVPARGFDINSMQAEVGFLPKMDAKDTSVQDLAAQEDGGTISGRSFIPLKDDRVGNSWTGNVRRQGRWRAVESKIIDSKDSSATNAAGRFRSTAYYGGVGSLVIASKENGKGNRMVYRIDALGRKMKLKALFALKAGRKVNPEATHFMRRASIQSGTRIEQYFITHAEAKINAMK